MRNMSKKMIAVCIMILVVFSGAFVTYAAGGKTPAPDKVWITGSSIAWRPAEDTSGLKFRIYYKDKWSGESYQRIATCKGYDESFNTARRASFYFRDATDEKDPEITREKADGHTYYSIPAISGHKYKIAVKVYDEKYGVWSDKTTAEYYYLSTPDVNVKQTKKGLSFSWKPVSGATKYYIERNKLSGDFEEKEFELVGNDSVTFLDEDVTKGEVYEYDISAARGKWASPEPALIEVTLPE